MNYKHYLSFNYHICEAKQITVAGKEGCLVQRMTFKLVTGRYTCNVPCMQCCSSTEFVLLFSYTIILVI